MATLSAWIADHAQPARVETPRILAFVGNATSVFRKSNNQTHQGAQWLANAAQREDGTATVGAFANIRTARLACLQQFSQPFQEHFHGQH